MVAIYFKSYPGVFSDSVSDTSYNALGKSNNSTFGFASIVLLKPQLTADTLWNLSLLLDNISFEIVWFKPASCKKSWAVADVAFKFMFFFFLETANISEFFYIFFKVYFFGLTLPELLLQLYFKNGEGEMVSLE